MKYVPIFLKGNWMKKASLYTTNPQKLKSILPLLGLYISRKGLSNIKDKLILIGYYLSDIAKGRYKEYDVKRLLIIVGAVIYIITPIDILPDLLPPGLIDDLSIASWAIKEASDELKRYNLWKKSIKTVDSETVEM